MIEINEDNLVEQFKNLSQNVDVDELNLFFEIEEDIQDTEKIDLIEKFNFNDFVNLKRLIVTISDFLDDISNLLLAISVFLSNVPYGLEKVEINFDFVLMEKDFYDEFDINMVMFMSKICDTVTDFKFCTNYAGFKLNKSLKDFRNLIFLELKFQCIGDLIGKRMKQIIKNNKELKTFSVTLIEINNNSPNFKKIDNDNWFLNLTRSIYEHENLNKLNIIWKFSTDNANFLDPSNDIIKRFKIKKSLKYLNENKLISNKNVLLKYLYTYNNDYDIYLKNICKKYIRSNQAINTDTKDL